MKPQNVEGDGKGHDSMKLNRTCHARVKPYKNCRRFIRGAAGEVNFTHKSPGELAGLFESLLNGFGKRHRRILFLRTFRTLYPCSLQELGDSYGVSRERIRQIESTCIKVIKSRLKTARFRPLIDASAKFAETFGLAVPIRVAEAAGLCRISGESTERKNRASFMRGFLLWLWGSYEVRDEWVIKRPANQAIRETQRVTRVLLRGGPASTEELIEKVCALGFRKDMSLQWVSTFGQVRVLGSAAIRWEGSLADKATAILEFQGVPMSREGISELLGPDHCIRTLGNYLSSDKRFRRLGRDLFGLSKWGGKEYRTIADTIEDVIRANGGEATVTDIISQVLARTCALQSSIRTYVYKSSLRRSDSSSYRARQAVAGRRSAR